MNRDRILHQLAEHKDELYRRYTARRIGAFGSVARGEAAPGVGAGWTTNV